LVPGVSFGPWVWILIKNRSSNVVDITKLVIVFDFNQFAGLEEWKLFFKHFWNNVAFFRIEFDIKISNFYILHIFNFFVSLEKYKN
jgi:hypothetical protein